MNDEHVQQIATWLQHTLLADQQQRQAAEAALAQAELQPGCVVALFRLAVEPGLNVAAELRQAAAVHMKNIVNRRWDPPSKPLRGGERVLPLLDADKASVRDNLVEAMCVAVPVVRVQLGTCLRTAAHRDYPDGWPGLLGQICTNLRSGETGRVHGGLFSLRVLAKVNQYRRENIGPAHQLVAETFPLLLGMLRSMLAAAPSVANAELALLAAKAMWSCVQNDLPPLLLIPASLEPWFDIMLGLLVQPLPEGAPSDPEDAAKWAPWKLKKRVAQIMHRVLQRYGNPKAGKQMAKEAAAIARRGGDTDDAVDVGADGATEMTFGGGRSAVVAAQAPAEVEAKGAALEAFARGFQDRVSGRCLQACLELLQSAKPPAVLPGRVHMLCLSYLEEAIKYKNTYTAILKPRLDWLFLEVIYPPLCFSESDAELWDSDPQEYVRRSLDVIEDYYSPRTAATNLLISLTTARTKDTLHGIVGACSAVLNNALQSNDATALRQKDGALLALGSLRKQLAKRDEYRPSLEPMIRMHVLPMLTSEHGFLRQRACWFYMQFAGSLFRKSGDADKQSGAPSPATEQMGHVFGAVVGCLRDRDLPVRVQAAITIKELVEQRCMPSSMVEMLPQLMELLFSLLREVGTDEVVATVDTLIEHYGEQMVPYAVQVVTALAASFMRLVDETDEDEEDDATLAALGVMQALGTMMEAIAGKADVYRQLEAPLLPLFRRCCQQDAEDYLEEMLELLSYITYYASEISPQLWELVPCLHTVYQDWGREYMNSLAVPLENVISRSPEAFLTLHNGQLVQMVVSMCRDALVSEQAIESLTEPDQHGAPKLVEAILHSCRGRIDAVVPDLIACILMRLESAESRSLKTLLYSALSSAIHYSPVLALQVLEHRQATTTLLTTWAGHLSTNEKLREHDLKMGLLAVASLLGTASANAPPSVAANRLHLLRLGLQVHTKLEALRAKKKREEEEGDDDGDDDDDDDDDEFEDGEELDDDDEGGKPMETRDALARLLRHAAGETSLKKLKLTALANGFGDDDASSDDLSDDEDNCDSPIDNIDELVAFTEAAQFASVEDADLLAKAGLQPRADMPSQLGADESTALRTALEAGVAKKSAPPAAQ